MPVKERLRRLFGRNPNLQECECAIIPIRRDPDKPDTAYLDYEYPDGRKLTLSVLDENNRYQDGENAVLAVNSPAYFTPLGSVDDIKIVAVPVGEREKKHI